ncbi:carbon storage regulator CsrA [Pseudomonas syringae group genomosp. 7]|uniref:carbon storage regulator CsrA n=1 Tax=Pseudomonas syringae group genomosp. 7 TaxID=251699 RepID=UPI00376F4D43
MLVLLREIGETVSICDDFIVQFLGINGNEVRLGINAPKDIKIHSAEVYKRIPNKLSQKSTMTTH